MTAPTNDTVTSPVVGSYRADNGARHDLTVRPDPEGGWLVLDLDTREGTVGVIDELHGIDDGRAQAEAVARDYLLVQIPIGARLWPGAGPHQSGQGGVDERPAHLSARAAG